VNQVDNSGFSQFISWLSRVLWPVRRNVEEFLESDLGRVRIVFVLLAGFFLMLLADLVHFFMDPQSGIWLVQTGWLGFLPDRLERMFGMFFSLESLRYFIMPVVTLGIAFMFGAHYIKDIYDLPSYQTALQYLLASLFGFMFPFLRISDGKAIVDINETNPLEAIGGPGYLMVSPGNAVLFERLRHPSSVRGPGLHFISRFEKLKEIVDLRDQHGYIEKIAAMSKDGIVVTVHDIHFRYRLWGGRRMGGNTGRSPEEPYPFSVQAVRNMVYNRLVIGGVVGNWDRAIQTAFEGEIQAYIRNNLLDAVTAPDSNADPRKAIKDRINARSLRDRLRLLGAELVWFDFGHFSFDDPAVEEQRIRTWSADYAGEADVFRSMGEGQVQAQHELARGEAQAELVMALVHSLHESGLSDSAYGDEFAKLFLLKTAQVLESMSAVYEPSQSGDYTLTI
jgi:hypothetical protein